MTIASLIVALLSVSFAGASHIQVSIKTNENKSFNPSSPINALAGWSYTDCGIPTDPFQLISLTTNPDPPRAGLDLTITLSFTAQETIEVGAFTQVTVKLGLVKILQKSFDLCEELKDKEMGIQCPIQKGQYTITHTEALPKEIPPAKFSVNVRAYTVNDDDLGCLDIKVDFMKAFSNVNRLGYTF